MLLWTAFISAPICVAAYSVSPVDFPEIDDLVDDLGRSIALRLALSDSLRIAAARGDEVGDIEHRTAARLDAGGRMLAKRTLQTNERRVSIKIEHPAFNRRRGKEDFTNRRSSPEPNPNAQGPKVWASRRSPSPDKRTSVDSDRSDSSSTPVSRLPSNPN
ncbi:hypothetical protein NUW58_g6843 [Xylaria curta]|uniref:Uncharacterized protein n=1 Tax=Xylaria curta TaxID=42375 RepID=A0ACC1NP36_9PEZI|nr:hypothetical protein NUW58_g6843 [Xylaria curta]